MSSKNVEITPLTEKSIELAPIKLRSGSVQAIALGALAMTLCILVAVTPIVRKAGKPFLMQLPANPYLLWWGSWLPRDMQLAQDSSISKIATNELQFLLLMAIAFIIYGLCALFIRRQPAQGEYRGIMRLIWIDAIVIGLIFVYTPSMLSRDIFVYAGYGRVIVAHHANPYFTTLSTFPQDPITVYDDWASATSAYGPAWLVISAAGAFLLGTSPAGYVIGFRLFDLAAHLLNTWLVATILKKRGQSPRTITLGTLLYAWNPLMLLESGLGGHNDILMITLVLLGILLSFRAEKRNFSRPVYYLPPVIAFTLAALVKFTALPLLAFFVVLLAFRTFVPSQGTREGYLGSWRSTLSKVLVSCTVSGLLALIFYAPFWIRHSVHDIVQSFSSPPSAYFSENSMLRVIFEWIKLHGLPSYTSWTYTALYTFSQRNVWDKINYATLFCLLIAGAVWLWRVPTIRTLMLASLATLGVLLVVTPWFFSWYVTWLVGLAAVCLPTTNDRIGRALVAFTLTFSASALVIYVSSIPWNIFSWLTMVGLPILVCIVFVSVKNKPELRSLDTNHTMTT